MSLRGIALTLALGSCTCALYGGEVSGFSGTGVSAWDVSGGACPSGALKLACPAGVGQPYSYSVTFVPRDAASVFPLGPLAPGWNTAPAEAGDLSKWIVPSVRSDSSVDYPPAGNSKPDVPGLPMDFGTGIYVFRTKFNVNGDPAGTVLQFRVWADGEGTAQSVGCFVRLNGLCVVVNGPDAPASFGGSGLPVSINTGFVGGANVLQIYVKNNLRETGLRVAPAGISAAANRAAAARARN